MQLTPAGSACSVTLMRAAEGAIPIKGLQVVAADIDAARGELLGRGVEVTEVFHFVDGKQTPGHEPDRVRTPVCGSLCPRGPQRCLGCPVYAVCSRENGHSHGWDRENGPFSRAVSARLEGLNRIFHTQLQPSRPEQRLEVMENRIRPAVLALATALVLVAGCGVSASSTTGSLSSKAAPSASAQGGPACRAAQLQLSAGRRISEANQQNTLLLVFRNTSATTCVMHGYPAIALADSAGQRLDFSYGQRGDQMLTNAPPALVILPPSGSAFTAVNKNSCVGSDLGSAASAEVTPPGQRGPLVLKLPRYPILGYCGAGDPGHSIDIAPVEPTSADVLAHG